MKILPGFELATPEIKRGNKGQYTSQSRICWVGSWIGGLMRGNEDLVEGLLNLSKNTNFIKMSIETICKIKNRKT